MADAIEELLDLIAASNVLPGRLVPNHTCNADVGIHSIFFLFKEIEK